MSTSKYVEPAFDVPLGEFLRSVVSEGRQAAKEVRAAEERGEDITPIKEALQRDGCYHALLA